MSRKREEFKGNISFCEFMSKRYEEQYSFPKMHMIKGKIYIPIGIFGKFEELCI